ncbi:MAG: EamA family transporter, partial [Cyanobacteria bacterium J06632_22]
MLWLLFASLTACFESLKDVSGKQSLKTLDEYTVLFSFAAIGALGLFVTMLATTGLPPLGPGYVWALLIGGGLNILAFMFYVRAIKVADLSLTVPLVTLTPLFLLFTSPLIVQEWPTRSDAVGVVLLVIGAYVLNLTPQSGQSVWSPLMTMIKNPGSRMMLGVAFLWSITSNFDKVGTVNSSPLCWGASLFAVVAAGMVPLMLLSSVRATPTRPPTRAVLTALPTLGLTGVFNAVAVGFQFAALTLAPVTQVIAVKRMSTVISVLFGCLLFQEPGLQQRLAGAAIMVVG